MTDLEKELLNQQADVLKKVDPVVLFSVAEAIADINLIHAMIRHLIEQNLNNVEKLELIKWIDSQLGTDNPSV